MRRHRIGRLGASDIPPTPYSLATDLMDRDLRTGQAAIRPALCLLAATFFLAGCGDDELPTGVTAGNLVLSSQSVTFEGDAGSTGPGAVGIEITSDGDAVSGLSTRIQYADDSPTGWVAASLDAGTTPATLSVTVSTPTLAWGGYTAAVLVDADDAGNGSQAVLISVQLDCPEASAGSMTVCGRIRDTETGAIAGAAASVVAYDALAYAGDPDGATPLATGVTDPSGRFRFLDVPTPSMGDLLMVVDDAAGGSDQLALTGRSIPAAAGTRTIGTTLYATLNDTDLAWTTSAGDPFGTGTFGSEGAVLSLFHDDEDPVPGVEVTVDGSPAASYYFSGTDPDLRSTVDPDATATGLNGAALTVGAGTGSYSGSGGEPSGTSWSASTAGDVSGLIWVVPQSPVQ